MHHVEVAERVVCEEVAEHLERIAEVERMERVVVVVMVERRAETEVHVEVRRSAASRRTGAVDKAFFTVTIVQVALRFWKNLYRIQNFLLHGHRPQ